jgi:uncharacterized membrane protein
MQYEWQYSEEQGRHQWMLRRNCVLTPVQLGGWFLSLALVSLGIAVAFAAHGAWLVVPFAVVEIGALGLAFVLYARHAGDYERIVAEPGRLMVEACRGDAVQVLQCAPSWVRVEYEPRVRGPIRLVAGRQKIPVGSLVPDHRRAALAQQLRGALCGG